MSGPIISAARTDSGRAVWLAQQRGRMATLYVARVTGNGETFYAAGITYSLFDLFGRLKAAHYQVEVVLQLGGPDAGIVYELEQRRAAQFPFTYRPALRFVVGFWACYARGPELLAWAKREGRRAGLRPPVSGATRAAWVARQNGRKAVLYVVRVYGNGEAFYKVGVTFCLSSRFSRLKTLYKWRTVARYSSYNAGKVFDLEQALHARFSALSYVPLLPFDGRTECYSEVEPILAALPKTTFFLKPTIDI